MEWFAIYENKRAVANDRPNTFIIAYPNATVNVKTWLKVSYYIEERTNAKATLNKTSAARQRFFCRNKRVRKLQ